MTEFLNKFDENLLKASTKKDLVDAKKEWQNFREEKCPPNQKKTCICNHKIQNVCYFLNSINGNIICCGTVCCTKFNLEQREIDNKTLGKILKLRNPYNEYHQFANIQEYLDYVKDELNTFLTREIQLSNKFNNLMLLLEDIDKINKLYGLDIFNIHIENIKLRMVEVIPSYIESEITTDISSIFEIMKKIGKLSFNYQVPITDINIFKDCIQRVVDNNITNYSGHTTPPFQQKIDNIIKKIEVIKASTGKSLILKDFFIEMNEKLKNKIQSIRDSNIAIDKAKYETQQRNRAKMIENNPKKYYF
jgi:hypothetical protein